MAERKLRLGIAGLGRGFSIMVPTFRNDGRVELVAAADPRAPARDRFASEFRAKTYATVEDLCRDPDAEAIYIVTPHEHHAEHVRLAAQAGKHVLVEKPMALTMAECRSMIAASQQANTHLIVGHSHSFNRPILRTREIIASGAVGRLRMITALNYTDFLYRPRRPEELSTALGGGVVFSQAAHQIDVVRLLGGGRLRSVRAVTGAWDASRPTEGAYMAMLNFDDGAVASITYSGYGHYDSDALMGWVAELGAPKDPNLYGGARKSLATARDAGHEAEMKAARNYGGPGYDDRTRTAPAGYNHFGFVLASCERGDLRPTPSGVAIYSDKEQSMEALPAPAVPRTEVIDELYDAVVHGKSPIHNGEWAMATMEACLALLRSAREGADVKLERQVPLREGA